MFCRSCSIPEPIYFRCMAVKDNTVPAVRNLVEFFIPQNSRGLCRSREKQIIILALGTISFLCFGSIFFLPEKSASGGKVKVVKDTLKNEFENLILPPPPADFGSELHNHANPNIRHGVIDKPVDDPHKEERKQLEAAIGLDEEIERIRQNQHKEVLAKPNLDVNKGPEKSSSSAQPQALDNNFAKPNNAADKKAAADNQETGDGEPKIQGGEDEDEVARQRRDHVKGVSVK